MAKYRDINQDRLKELAEAYCDECITHTKEYMTNSGKAYSQEDRYIPTVEYFIYHWLRRNHKEFYDNMLKRSQFYKAMKEEEHPLSDTIKNIRELFDGVAVDIVANEGKGIFYAKNRLGMTDRMQTENTNRNIEILNIDPLSPDEDA